MTTLPKRVLVVDDDVSTMVALAELLEQAGYRPVTVAGFKEALQILRGHPPDILITDIRLGGYNGLQLIISGAPRVPAIVMTGFDDRTLAATAHEFGADYLVKPVDPRALLQLVASRIGDHTGVHD